MRHRYVWRDGAFWCKRTGALMTVRDPDAICAPMVMRDIPEYVSPATGKLIGSRSTQRDDLARSGCYIAEPAKKGFKNKRFAKKHNLPLREDVA